MIPIIFQLVFVNKPKDNPKWRVDRGILLADRYQEQGKSNVMLLQRPNSRKYEFEVTFDLS